ncbi:Crp/Fnr family transcriptional regulator [Psychrobacillus sp. Sa2BUA9]|uniref:Crp/Fnr family transcriptional regulator n=1 Tax=Psychrobacillus faecigallinarum TaxID=2762235 RepID=A0ABR8R5I6_9BACI|nr:Crp/Fnr family transcriptional regulator [Psychrobacillus faecigallinarum]
MLLFKGISKGGDGVDNSLVSPNIGLLFKQYGSIIKLEKDRSVYVEGELAEEIYLVISGSIAINKDTEGGKLLTLRIVGPDNCIGESGVFADNAHHSFSAHTLETTQLLMLPKNKFESFLVSSTELMVEWTKYIQLVYLKNQTRFRDLMLHGKKGALFSTLIRLANTYGEKLPDDSIKINFQLTNQEIANLCAMSREVVNRMLNDLKNEGIVSFQKGVITIHDLELLKRENQCESCPLCVCRID